MIAANIPWNKVQVPKYRAFLEKYCGRRIPDESTLRKCYLEVCYREAIDTIRAEIGSSYIWISVDETTDVLGRYVANLIIGKLSADAPSKSYLIASKVLERTNHSTIARFVNDGLKVLWPGGVQEEKVLVLYTDSAAYMLKAASALKVFYPHLLHSTCMAHALQRVAEEVRANFCEVNRLVSSTKKMFVKAPQRVQVYRDQLPDVPLPPEPVLTRWGTWIQAVHFYNEHFQKIKPVVDSFPSESAVSVGIAQKLFKDSKEACDIAYIDSNFGWLAESIKKLETVGRPLLESMEIIEDAKRLLQGVCGDVGEKVRNKLNAVLERNPGYDSLLAVCEILSGKTRTPPEDISPNYIPLLKYAPVTTCDVERSFSAYKNILSDRRQNFTSDHLEMYLVTHCTTTHS